MVDLGGVTSLDSSGIGVLVAALRATRLAGHRFQSRGEQESVRRTLEITVSTFCCIPTSRNHQTPAEQDSNKPKTLPAPRAAQQQRLLA